MTEITLFVNPAADRGRAAHAPEPAARVLRAAGFAVRTVAGRDAAEGLDRARAAVASGTSALVGVGGDGLASLAFRAVAGTGVPLGLVAAGTCNDFARTLGLPLRDPRAAARVIAGALRDGRIRSTDLARVGERLYGTVLGAGFDSRANARGNRMRGPLGPLRYDLAALAELAALRSVRFRITLDGGKPRELDTTLVAVGNGPSYGGGMRICPGARPDDGLLDVTVVRACSRRTLLRLLAGVRRGTHLGNPAVDVHRAHTVALEAPGVTAYADGEPVGPLPLTVRSVPGAVRVLARQ
ncbi:diacylglycerol kinase family protein [Streptomyces sp. JJ36]|uniref:diacylglycerol kinase family protein n=1 Tax=Streptomyces sp. JJ36 TaxID=2736645 RepID=UPI001F217C88|nr:diacylglycerol kinase family protein [Streptomyces sp. JJ36]MCF6523204.1 sphingosine kinase [Streptomyces sp. JJ36]